MRKSDKYFLFREDIFWGYCRLLPSPYNKGYKVVKLLKPITKRDEYYLGENVEIGADNQSPGKSYRVVRATKLHQLFYVR
jgi:hypothetical protein